MHLLGETK